MSDLVNRAVFLSYASQDTEAAKRICDALRAAGVEVWFDQNELRGGEAWDAKIKKQIRECALFMPIVSANTQARPEGYFRLEWHLAEQRSLLIARGRPFLVPVSLDDTTERDALVPDAFLAVQWTRLSGDVVDPALVQQVKRLLTVSATPVGTGSRAATASVAVVHAGPPVIPDFELLREIGQGAYGDVWLARGVTGVYRAIKIVWRDRFNRTEPFEREFHGLKKFSAMSLPEANQLALLHVGQNTAAGYFYYVMELADDVATGRDVNPAQYVPLTLREVRTRRGRLPAAECVAFGIALARALAGLHERGLVHRDIKPSNIILVGGVPKLADIGLVAEAQDALSYVGTEGFVPPEGPGKPSADVFALGKLLYELATGLDREEFPRLPPDLGRESDRKLFFRLNDILLHACDSDPTKRYPDARALLTDLSKLGSAGTAAKADPASRAASHSWPKTILALGGMAIGLAFAWRWVWVPAHRRESAPEFPAVPPLPPTASSGATESTPLPPAKEKLAGAPVKADEKSVAVLAFANLSGDKNNDYFSDGISEELLNVLAKIPELKVSARTSAFYFKGREVPIPEIALKLGVAYVVEGSVRKIGNQVRISAQLIKAADGFQVWSDTFTRDLKDIFALQDEIAGLIAENLSLKLGMAALSSGRPVDPEAYRLVLLGRSLVYRYNDGDANQALIYFQQAIDRDPEFALAWAWLAIGHWGKASSGDESYETGAAAVKTAALQALQFDPKLSVAHAALGLHYYTFAWDWAKARVSFERALELAPGDAARYSNLSKLAATVGQLDEAVRLARRAVELDPLNSAAQSALCVAYFLGGRWSELDVQTTQWLEFSDAGSRYRIFALLLMGRKEEALKLAGQSSGEKLRVFHLALAQWSGGQTAESDANLNQMKSKYASALAYQIAETHAWRGEADAAFEWLENSFKQRDPGLIWLKNDPFFKNLHGDRRWDGLLHRMNLADDQLK